MKMCGKISVTLDPKKAWELGLLMPTDSGWWRHGTNLIPQMTELIVIRKDAVKLVWAPMIEEEIADELTIIFGCVADAATYRFEGKFPTGGPRSVQAVEPFIWLSDSLTVEIESISLAAVREAYAEGVQLGHIPGTS